MNNKGNTHRQHALHYNKKQHEHVIDDMRTSFRTLYHKLKSVVVFALLLHCCIAAPVLLHSKTSCAPQAEERRGATGVWEGKGEAQTFSRMTKNATRS